MALRANPIQFNPNKQQTTEERTAEALEFIAIRLGSIEDILDRLRGEVSGLAHVLGVQASVRKP
jgi:hypothetical protein